MHACQLAFLGPYARLGFTETVFTESEKLYSVKDTKPLGRLPPHQLQSLASLAHYTVPGTEASLVGLRLAKSTCHTGWISLHVSIIVRFKSAYQQPFATPRELGKVEMDFPPQDRARTLEAHFRHIVKLIPNFPEELCREFLQPRSTHSNRNQPIRALLGRGRSGIHQSLLRQQLAASIAH